MSAEAQLLDARLDAALGATPSPVPFVVGPCGSGRTALLRRLRERLGPSHCQYLDAERITTTPERFHQAMLAATPFTLAGGAAAPPAGPRAAFDATVGFLQAARAFDGSPAVFLVDEVLELRTFESFPGLRTVLADVMAAIADSPNRFVLTSRFTVRARRLLDAAPPRLEMHTMPALDAPGAREVLREAFAGTHVDASDEETARAVHVLSGGHVGYARALATQMRFMSDRGLADPLGALSALLAPGGRLSHACRFCYELRLHRARGYGALKAGLDILAEEEPLTLTAIARRLGRTPGSTKDYLSWLEDVDLVSVSRKRYRFADPLLRTWVRLYSHPGPPSDDDVGREVQRYATDRLALPQAAPEAAPAAVRSRGPDIIEFD